MEIINREFLDVCTKTCHASTMVIDPRTIDPVFAWFGGVREGESDSSIYVQYAGVVKTIGTKNSVAYWNPILFSINNRIYLSFKIGIYCDRWQTYIVDITEALDDIYCDRQTDIKNLDYLEPQIIPAGLNFCVKTKPIIEPNGLIYCGSSVESIFDWSSYCEIFTLEDGRFVFIDRSKPLTVEKQIVMMEGFFGMVTKRKTLGIIQPALWKDNIGRIHAFFRSSRGLGKIYYAMRSQETQDWTSPCPTKFDNPNSSIDVVYSDKRLFLAHNPDKKYRYPLVISELNKDFEIKEQLMISEKPNNDCFSAEFSYPFMIEKNGILHLTYTFERDKIEYVQIKV